MVERFSPYYQTPAAFGLTEIKPVPFYRFLYHVDEATLTDLAYDFTHEYADGRNPYDYARPVVEFAEQWRAGYVRGKHTLTYRRGPGFVLINDRRFNLSASDYYLGDIEADIYLACDAGATPAAVWQRLQQQGHNAISIDEVKEFLAALLEARLVYEEEGRYLSLAVALNAEAEEAAIEESEVAAALVQIGRASGVLATV